MACGILALCVRICDYHKKLARINSYKKNADSSFHLDLCLSWPSPSLTTCCLLTARALSLLVSSTASLRLNVSSVPESKIPIQHPMSCLLYFQSQTLSQFHMRAQLFVQFWCENPTQRNFSRQSDAVQRC